MLFGLGCDIIGHEPGGSYLEVASYIVNPKNMGYVVNSCALSTSHEIICWGKYTNSTLVLKDKFSFMTSQYGIICGITKDSKKVKCFDPTGIQDDHSGIITNAPQDGSFTHLSKSDEYMPNSICAINFYSKPNDIFCWGYSDWGEIASVNDYTGTFLPPSVELCSIGGDIRNRKFFIFSFGSLLKHFFFLVYPHKLLFQAMNKRFKIKIFTF